jgi:sensor histidine kinase YesM
VTALAVPVLNAAINHWPNWTQSLAGYLIGIVYAFCIGGILSPLSPGVWKRSCQFPAVPRWLARALFILFGTVTGCMLAGIPMIWFLGPRYQYWASFRDSLQIALVLSILATVFLVIYGNFKSKLEISQIQLKEKEVEREKALKLATEATLSSLESRLHPHFLFNTINSISSLIQEDPARAEKMLSQMADLLRFSLDSARTSLVPLSRELKIVHDYLEIEKARFENRLRYQIEIPAEFDDTPFPPLSLQTLVENSVKYAVSATRTGADIAIRGQRDGSQLIISVEDNGPGFDSSDLPVGHGLSSLVARLDSLYQSAAQMKIGSEAGRTVVALRIPLSAGVKP